MIANCKYNIINFRRIKLGQTPFGQLSGSTTSGKKAVPIDDTILWDHDQFPPDELIVTLQTCLDLHEAYVK
jgi:hypothetical protein